MRDLLSHSARGGGDGTALVHTSCVRSRRSLTVLSLFPADRSGCGRARHSRAPSSRPPARRPARLRGCASWWDEAPLVLGSDLGEARRMLLRHTARRRFPTELSFHGGPVVKGYIGCPRGRRASVSAEGGGRSGWGATRGQTLIPRVHGLATASAGPVFVVRARLFKDRAWPRGCSCLDR